MSKIKSRLYELYLIEEENKGSKMVLSEKAFYDQFDSNVKTAEETEEDPWFKKAYDSYKKTYFELPFAIGKPVSFEVFKKEIETNGQIKIENVFGVCILKAKRS